MYDHLSLKSCTLSALVVEKHTLIVVAQMDNNAWYKNLIMMGFFHRDNSCIG